MTGYIHRAPSCCMPCDGTACTSPAAYQLLKPHVKWTLHPAIPLRSAANASARLQAQRLAQSAAPPIISHSAHNCLPELCTLVASCSRTCSALHKEVYTHIVQKAGLPTGTGCHWQPQSAAQGLHPAKCSIANKTHLRLNPTMPATAFDGCTAISSSMVNSDNKAVVACR